MRKPRDKTAEPSDRAARRVSQPSDELSNVNRVRELQQSAGNQALLGLLVASERKAETVQFKRTGLMVQRAARDEAATGQAGLQSEPASKAITAAPSLIVEDDAADVKPEQMRKSEFIAQLRSAVCSTAEQALAGTMWSAMGCPYIERWLDHYSNQPSAYLERALRKYAPETANARSARDYIPLVTQRVRRGIEEWRSTGEVKDLPQEFAAGGMPGATVSGLVGGLLSGVGSAISGLVSGAGHAIGGAISSIGSMLFKHREGSSGDGAEQDPAAIQAQLGSGQALDSAVQRRMQSAFGVDFAGVRVHTDARARELTDGLQARAFTIGNDIAFGAEEYQPGTPVGDALIAHELAHVVQQGGDSAAATTQHKGGTASGALEEDADRSAVGAVVKLWTGARGDLSQLGHSAMPRLRSGLRLQGCTSPKPKQADQGLELGTFWSAESVMKVLFDQGDEDVVRTIIDKGYTILSFETAFDTYRYPDGKEVEVELEGLKGNTDQDSKEIRIRETLSTQAAATALFHEVGHAARGKPKNTKEGLEQEIEVRIATEEFLIKHGWPPFEPEYRNKDGTVNKDAIRKDIMGSEHYNPQDRKWVRRRYEGEKQVKGWKLP